jgi:hypothetical protein
MKGSGTGRVRGYLRPRKWIVAWAAIFLAALIALAATGQIHIQGNGWPTWYELSVPLIAAAIWAIARFVFKTDLTEEYLLGIIFGVQWEFLTEPYWTYLPDRFNVLVWKTKDIPLLALPGWGTTFALALLLTNWIGKEIFRLKPKELLFDWRVLFCDALSIQLIGMGAEWTYGILLHCWDYEIDFGMGKSPLGLGWEIHIGYMIVMFWYATTMRVWKLKLEDAL